jgi:CubicO group peptidase (beta-lactamase class C family)
VGDPDLVLRAVTRPRRMAPMRAKIALLIAVLAALAALSSPAPAVDAQGAFAAVDAVAQRELAETQAPGAALAIVLDGKVVYSTAYGVANVETGEATRPEMLFRLGSTTKMFTAAAVVLLAEQGRIDLNAAVGTYVPGLAPRIAALTPHQLLSHQSGFFDEAPMFGSHDDDALKREATSWTDARFFADPGQIYSYSNPGYWLAGLLAEQVGGRPFADQVATTIFAPLGMTRSTFRPTIAMTYPLAQGHDVVDGKPRVIRPSANNTASWPAGSIFSSVADLSRWISAFVSAGVLDGEQVMPAAVFTRLASPHAAVPGSNTRYGYGVSVGPWRGMHTVSHGGSRSGYGSFIRMVPSRRAGVVVLANRSGVSMPRTAEAALEAALQLPGAPAAPSTRKPEAPGAADRARLAGTYSQGPRQITISVKDGALVLRQGARELPMQKIGELEFTAGATRYVFVADAAGAVTFLHSGGRSWRKIE